MKTQFLIKKEGIHRNTSLSTIIQQYWAQPVWYTTRNQTKVKFSFSWMEFYGLCWSLAPNWLRDRDWPRTDLLLLHRRATTTKHGLRILTTLPNKTMGCRNKMTVSVTCTPFNPLIAFNYLTEDNQLQVLTVPVLHWRQFSCRSSGGGSTPLPEEQMHFGFSCPLLLELL